MDGLTVVFILLFGLAALVPAVWSIIDVIRGNSWAWPCVAGTAFALVLLIITIVGIATNWGGCPVNGGTSEGSVQCYQDVKGKWVEQCEPDVWKEQCHQSVPDCHSGNASSKATAAIPKGGYCPAGKDWVTVFSFCEPIKEGGVKQPWATWSDLSFVAAGLWLLWFFRFFGNAPRLFGDNPMSDITVLSVAYCFIVIFMGPPSMWYHASMKQWGGWFDTMSVVAWLGFNAVYVIYLLVAAMWGKGRNTWQPVMVLGIWGLIMAAFGITAALNTKAHLFLYFGTGGPWGIAEVIYVFMAAFKSGVRYRRTWFLFVINLVLLAATMTLWIFFNDGVVAQGCAGRAGFPGHALFHIMASISTMLTYFSFASERSVDQLNDINLFNPFRNA
jgi:hypothetical protein